ncbi:hypothetical protein [Corallococcus sp. EGB]|uniref:hypothetical protein n=1 Tax=Corallococcus sp. EGB TaxID=1521117 RepID=UPI001CBA9AE9|nr:hypothetical protein [Corallococcus sp. EGB]
MKKLIGVFASVALLGSGVAFAQDSTAQDSQQQSSTPSESTQGSSGSMQGSSGSSMGSSDATGGSGSSSSSSHSMGSSSSTMGSNELTGRVVKSEGKKVYISSASGAVVPLDIDSKTQFNDPSLKSAKSLKEGQEIRASFQVKDERNMATSISPSTGTGGAGSDVMSPDQSINEGTKDQTQEQGSGKSSTMNPDTGSSTGSSGSPKTY